MGILTGRDRIALTDGDDEVELNVSLDLHHTYPAEITRHTVEKEIGMTSITDHVIPGQRGITLNALLSSSTSVLSLSRTTVEEKLDILVRWQSSGALVTLLGYGTGGIIGKILSMLPSVFRYVEPSDPDNRYLGRSTDEIPNLIIGDLNIQETKDTGDDVAMSVSLFPVLIAEAKTRQLRSVKSAGGRTPQKQTKTGNPPPVKSTSWLGSFFQ
ncbi:hypothetical protein LEP1GSC060_0780 [Leptospira weilii serovar Ranarum str. ICFT]|uniref:Dit-like phage tail protein N-terminal domain-containing protein n=1 Tax=Leptospira weilii serovar Ranarum str. ICFT TaxID=1218598 RepID=N1WIY6_9LEPT|nr:hypothetical protein [Leptospira weilii]EMY78895.1 hypothetical protein LEP1GSC060_0780 [Leptospira weilii serovar Ranarum str. ICFT]